MKYLPTTYEIAAWLSVIIGFLLFCFDKILFAIFALIFSVVFMAIDYCIFIARIRKIFKK
jgi:hypothetical protein